MRILEVFKSLSDSTRLRLWAVLNYHELTVSEIVRIMDMGQSRVSRHLKIMTDAGVLTARRNGLRVFYTVRHDEELEGLWRFVGARIDGAEPYGSDVARADSVMRERKLETTKFFDEVAESWELLRAELYGAVDVNADILASLSECATVADIGCGTGDLTEQLAGRAETVIGVDNSRGMLQRARAKLAGREGVQFRLGDIEHLPLRDAEVDCAVMNMVLHHLDSPAAGLREAHRALSPGGTLVLTELGPHENQSLRAQFGDRWMGFEARLLAQWLKSTGFTPEEPRVKQLESGLELILIQAIRSDAPPGGGSNDNE